ncbi:MAG: hypothetical protein HQK79_08650 [Desulfobacterales bacterium]|nr:hypothetical protein [Desulfobacterales bacterium]
METVYINPLIYFFRLDNKTKSKTIISTDEKKQDNPEEEKYLLCNKCLQVITLISEKIEINGNFSHTFVNPEGILFRIGCFRNAIRCLYVGTPTNEFTWFPGFYWEIALCSRCLNHMGWRFTSSAESFHGLILDRLIEA